MDSPAAAFLQVYIATFVSAGAIPTHNTLHTEYRSTIY